MVTIIDRTGERQEFKFDQRVWAFAKGKETLVLPEDVATWLFRDAQHRVHTTDGRYEYRYGVTDAPEDWVAEIGVSVLETAPLQRDAGRVELWDAEAVDPLRNRARVLDLRATPNRPRSDDYVNQGAAAAGAPVRS